MNIFFLDKNPIIAATYLCDKHVVRMILETAQILSTVSWRYGVAAPYKPTHKNHPSVLWAGNFLNNWRWLISHGRGMSAEYTKRYGKIHKSQYIIEWCQNNGGRPIKDKFTNPSLCMPEKYKDNDYVKAYRSYYLGDKIRFAKWKFPAKPPYWWKI